jgi:hypothetical protein
MNKNKVAGNKGEQQVIKLVPCPNCGKALMKLPESFPIYDLQCTGCFFRVQVKSSQSKPRPGNVIRGAGWAVIDKALKSGMLMPPLIVNYQWTENGKKRHRIVFYPFVRRDNLKKRRLSDPKRSNYWMYDYVGLDQLPYLVLYDK